MVLLEAVFLVVFWTWVGSAFLLLRQAILLSNVTALPPQTPQLSVEPVVLHATDGLRLAAWKVPGDDPTRPWIILCHDAKRSPRDLLDLAVALRHERFNLLLLGFRGHGGSDGWATSWGWREQRDLEGALVWLGRQPDVPARPYGVYGCGMGGSVALLVAARDERLGAIVTERPYATLQEGLKDALRRAYPFLPPWPTWWFVAAAYRLWHGVWPHRVAPQKLVAQLTSPCLLIHQPDVQRITAFFKTHLSFTTFRL